LLCCGFLLHKNGAPDPGHAIACSHTAEAAPLLPVVLVSSLSLSLTLSLVQHALLLPNLLLTAALLRLQMITLQLVELFSSCGAATAVPLQLPSTATCLCSLVTTCSLLPPSPSSNNPQEGCLSNNLPLEVVSQRCTTPPPGPHDALTVPLAALCCLRLITTHQSHRSGAADSAPSSGFATHLFKCGLYQAISRLLVQAAALAVPQLNAGGTEGGVAGASPPPAVACRNAKQHTARRALLERLPAPHAHAKTPLGRLMGELAMWTGVGWERRGGWAVRGDVVAPLCSAVFDCFAFERRNFILEQPGTNLTDSHLCASRAATIICLCILVLDQCAVSSDRRLPNVIRPTF
jgi:hypothetical protein